MSVMFVVLYSFDRKRTGVEGRVQDGAVDRKLECFGGSWIEKAYTLSFCHGKSATVEHVRRKDRE